MINSKDRIVKHKLGLLNLADELSNVSQACKIMGVNKILFTATAIPDMKLGQKRRSLVR